MSFWFDKWFMHHLSVLGTNTSSMARPSACPVTCMSRHFRTQEENCSFLALWSMLKFVIKNILIRQIQKML